MRADLDIMTHFGPGSKAQSTTNTGVMRRHMTKVCCKSWMRRGIVTTLLLRRDTQDRFSVPLPAILHPRQEWHWNQGIRLHSSLCPFRSSQEDPHLWRVHCLDGRTTPHLLYPRQIRTLDLACIHNWITARMMQQMCPT